MKKILMMLALCFSFNAYAEWVHVVTDSDEGKIYVNDKAITIKDDHVFAWTMWSGDDLAVFKVRSSKSYVEYDCIGRRPRVLSWVSYSDYMGAGSVVDSENSPSDWRYIAPDTAEETILNYVCSFRKSRR